MLTKIMLNRVENSFSRDDDEYSRELAAATARDDDFCSTDLCTRRLGRHCACAAAQADSSK